MGLRRMAHGDLRPCGECARDGLVGWMTLVEARDWGCCHDCKFGSLAELRWRRMAWALVVGRSEEAQDRGPPSSLSEVPLGPPLMFGRGCSGMRDSASPPRFAPRDWSGQSCTGRRPVVLRALSFHGTANVEFIVTAPEIVTMGDLMAHVLTAHLWWPPEFVEFVVRQEVFVHHSRLASRSIRPLRMLEVAEVGALRVAIVVRPPPAVFPFPGRDGTMMFGCMCSFGRCCRFGRAGHCSHGTDALVGYCTGCGRPPGTLCSRCENPCQIQPMAPHLAEGRQCFASVACLTRWL